jgi:uncharacterized membrane protein
MKTIIHFIWKTTIIGVLFIAPLLLALVLVREAIHVIAKVLGPIADHLPISPAFGLAKPEMAAAILLVVVVFVAGLISQTSIGANLQNTMEQLILRKMPGYTLFKSIVEGTAGVGGGELRVVLANLDDAWLIGFIIEQHADGLLTVFVPSAPTPTAGSIYFLTERQVKRLDVSVSAAVKCIRQLGVGSRELLRGRIELPDIEKGK